MQRGDSGFGGQAVSGFYNGGDRRINKFLRGMAMIFGLSGSIHVLLILPFLLFHKILTKLTGIDVG